MEYRGTFKDWIVSSRRSERRGRALAILALALAFIEPLRMNIPFSRTFLLLSSIFSSPFSQVLSRLDIITIVRITS